MSALLTALGLPAGLPARPPACPPACLPACPPACLQDRTSVVRDINGYTWNLMEMSAGQVSTG
jgi:hypothetical protein